MTLWYADTWIDNMRIISAKHFPLRILELLHQTFATMWTYQLAVRDSSATNSLALF